MDEKINEKFQSRAEQLAAEEFASSATTIEELNGLMRLMMKSGLERMLNTEMDVHLGRQSEMLRNLQPLKQVEAIGQWSQRSFQEDGTRRSGGSDTRHTSRSRWHVRAADRIGKHQRRIPDFDEKILALYAKGMTTRDIQEIVEELYGVEVSAHTWFRITADSRRRR